MDPPDELLVSVYTRWHQGSVIGGIVLCPALAISVIHFWHDFVIGIVLGMIGLLGPGLIAFRGFPSKDTVVVQPHGLAFSRRGWVPYSEILSYGADDYLKLKRAGRTTLLVAGRQTGHYARLCGQFIRSIEAWHASQPAGTPQAGRTRFYGGPLARTIGGLLVLGSFFAAWAAWSFTPPKIYLLAMGGTALVVGLAMLAGRKPSP
ncbi:hypothetical protein CDO44_24525 [Pigmentiphaga sp. NML080357]|nr:hypothetical protein CDO44_24525 [Pigmentiphaga sp. NML080357]